MGEKIIHRLQHIVTRQKYVKVSITEKGIVFYGTVDYFKSTQRNYPHLNFKLFIDSSKDNGELTKFLSISTEVVMTHLRICPCQPEYASTISCRVILIRSKLTTLKSCEKIEVKSCPL